MISISTHVNLVRSLGQLKSNPQFAKVQAVASIFKISADKKQVVFQQIHIISTGTSEENNKYCT